MPILILIVIIGLCVYGYYINKDIKKQNEEEHKKEIERMKKERELKAKQDELRDRKRKQRNEDIESLKLSSTIYNIFMSSSNQDEFFAKCRKLTKLLNDKIIEYTNIYYLVGDDDDKYRVALKEETLRAQMYKIYTETAYRNFKHVCRKSGIHHNVIDKYFRLFYPDDD